MYIYIQIYIACCVYTHIYIYIHMCTSYVGFECTHVYIDVCVYIFIYIYIYITWRITSSLIPGLETNLLRGKPID